MSFKEIQKSSDTKLLQTLPTPLQRIQEVCGNAFTTLLTRYLWDISSTGIERFHATLYESSVIPFTQSLPKSPPTGWRDF